MHRTYPSQLDGGQAYTLGLQLLMAKNLSVAVDDAALADTDSAWRKPRASMRAQHGRALQPRDEGAADAGAKTPCNCQGP